MLSKQHIAFGFFSGAVVASGYQISDVCMLNTLNASIAITTSIFSSLVPDIDSPGSPIAKALPFISNPIQKRWPHRTLFHSILGAIISSTAIYTVVKFFADILPIPDKVPSMILVFFFAGYIGHLIVDSLTITGVKWLWPFQRAFAYPTSRRYRISTGDKKEKYYALLFLFLFLLYTPVLKAGGASRAIHKTFKNFQMAKEDYVKAANIETYLTFKGSYRHDRLSIVGRSLILDATEDYFIIYLDNKVLTIGEQALVLGTEFICEYTNKPPKISEVTIVNQSIDSILVLVPANTLISGELVSEKKFQVNATIYTANDFKIIGVTSSGIKFTYATKEEVLLLGVRIPEDIRKLQALVRTLEEDIQVIASDIDTLIEKMSLEQELIERYTLQKQIEELREKQSSMKKNLENNKLQLADFGNLSIEFTGKLYLRELP